MERRLTGIGIIGAVLLVIGMSAFTSCSPIHEQTPKAQPSQASDHRGEVLTAREEHELNSWLNTYLVAQSTSFRSRRLRGWDGEDDYFGHVVAMGLVARTRVEHLGEAAIPTIIGRLHTAQRGDGSDEPDAIQGLFAYLGTPGLKAMVRATGCYDTPSSDDDESWLRFLRAGEGRAHDEPFAWPLPQLWWRLAHDRAALSQCAWSIDYSVGILKKARNDTGGSLDDVDNEGDLVEEVLGIGAPADGVSIAKLREWARRWDSPGVHWAALLALAIRGVAPAQQQVTKDIAAGLILPPGGGQTQSMDSLAEWGRFIFVRKLAESPIEGRWDILTHLVERDSPRLLISRTAAMVAIEENWAHIDAAAAHRVRDSILAVQWKEKDSWLRSFMVSFLAQHPPKGS